MHALDADSHRVVDYIFPIEEPEALEAFLSERLEKRVLIRHHNKSHDADMPSLSTDLLRRVRALFPFESTFYGV